MDTNINLNEDNYHNLKHRLKHKLSRNQDLIDKLELKYKGKEPEYTFHAGYDLGYAEGMQRVYEECLDILHDIVFYQEDITDKLVAYERDCNGIK